MNQPDRPYFQLEQAKEVARIFSKHNVEFLFIGKSGAIILGYPSATQDVDLFPRKSEENGRNLVNALRELDFRLTKLRVSRSLPALISCSLNKALLISIWYSLRMASQVSRTHERE